MSFVDKVKAEAQAKAKMLAEKSQEFAADHKDQVLRGLEKVETTIDAKTQGKYHDKIAAAQDKAAAAVDKVASRGQDGPEVIPPAP